MAKNDWSLAIIDMIGPGKASAVVMENRRMDRKCTDIAEAARIISQGAKPSHYPPEEWSGLAGKYYDYLTSWNR